MVAESYGQENLLPALADLLVALFPGSGDAEDSNSSLSQTTAIRFIGDYPR